MDLINSGVFYYFQVNIFKINARFGTKMSKITLAIMGQYVFSLTRQ